MAAQTTAPPAPSFLPRAALDELVQLLRKRGYTVLAPVQVDGAISLRPVESATQIAHGLRDQQDGGTYRLAPGDPDLTFEYVVGMDGPKRYLFPPRQRLFSLHVEGGRFVMDAGPPQPPKLAFLGVRPCELAAIAVQDKAFDADNPATMRCESEAYYSETRRQALFIAVNCSRPGGTCFCVSMETGPQATQGFDLALTELRGGFVVHVGTPTGAGLLAELPARAPTSAEVELAEFKMAAAREHMGRTLDTRGLKQLLDQSIEHPQWVEVAKRCLSCGNCTMVCPTCFCSTVSESTDLSGAQATRTREWESCYTHQFSYTTAGPVRNTIRGRYRHWMRHKLCTWFDQFACGGCVGCGRCITWCPVGIDLTQESQRIRQTSPAAVAAPAVAAGKAVAP